MKNKFVQGIVKRHPDGFGFLLPNIEGVPDVYISRNEMQGIMTNDRLEVEIFGAGQEDRLHGKVRKVLERGTQKIVGKLTMQENGFGFVQETAEPFGVILKIPPGKNKNAKQNDWVAVRITQYPDGGKDFLGEVVDIIGDVQDPINDIKRVAHTHQLSMEFSAQTLAEADALPDHVLESELAHRKDLRELALITIDGVTAKDFDDAIFVNTNPKGFHLWVAIADVSHYVRPGTAMDRDAYQRGTSTYFPNFVIPMLPEKISNELCSLKPNVDRLSYVCEMQINFQGVVESHSIYEAVIHSHARVTYGEAQEIIEEEKTHTLPAVTKNIKTAADLAKILMSKRFREGSLELEIPETQVIVDHMGQPTDISRSERVFAHRLIEELMLIANVTVAKHLSASDLPAIYRIHEMPDREDIDILQRFLFQFGSQRKIGVSQLQKKLTKALQEYQNKPEGIVLNILTLRSMKQAKYSDENIGHFGLGFEFYTHFTSPIRRYPDLIVHRLLKRLTLKAYKHPVMDDAYLATAATLLSACEQRSVKAERQLISIKKARFMEAHLGETFEGVISSVVKFGIFVLLRQFDVDGLVRIDQLGKEVFQFDPENLMLKGKRTGKIFKIGDKLEVQVARSSTEEGQIDFVLAGSANRNLGDGESKKHKTPYSKNQHQKKHKSKFSKNKREDSYKKEKKSKKNNWDKKNKYKIEESEEKFEKPKNKIMRAKDLFTFNSRFLTKKTKSKKS